MILKKTLIASLVAVAMSAGVAQATTVNAGTVGVAPSSYLFQHSGGSFSDTVNFDIAGPSVLSGSANNIFVSLMGMTIFDIAGLTVNVWDNSHPNGIVNFGSFAGNNSTYTFNLPSAGSYHVDITGTTTGIAGGSYGIALSAAPVPEPETYALLLAGLGLMGGIARRRKQAAKA